MEKLMQERIEKFNQLTMNSDFKRIPVGLYYGKMGLCIYFYELAHLISEKKHRVFAEKLLRDIVDNVAENTPIDLENGLTGICVGINYLLDKGYVTGNPKHVLKDFDNKIIQSLFFSRIYNSDKNLTLNNVNSLLGILVYLVIRLQHTGLSKYERCIIQGVIIENINKIESCEIEKFTEPALFSVIGYFTPLYLQLLQRIYQLHFYDYKIDKIVESLSSHIFYCYPLNKANRLSLYSAMNEVATTFGNIRGWDKHIEVLQQHLDIPSIIHEFLNKNMAFFNGLCGFYYLLRKMGRGDEYKDLFLNKISNSDIWNQLSEIIEKDLPVPIGLYGGLSGVILTYLHLLHDSNSVIIFDKIISQYV